MWTTPEVVFIVTSDLSTAFKFLKEAQSFECIGARFNLDASCDEVVKSVDWPSLETVRVNSIRCEVGQL